MTGEEKLMDLNEVAEYLKVTPRTVLRYVSKYGLPHLRGPGGKTYFD